MYRKFIKFITTNRISLIALLCGVILGYIHWYHCGCYWGSYPFSQNIGSTVAMEAYLQVLSVVCFRKIEFNNYIK